MTRDHLNTLSDAAGALRPRDPVLADAVDAARIAMEATDPEAVRRVAFREAYRILEEKLEKLEREDDAMPVAMRAIQKLGWPS